MIRYRVVQMQRSRGETYNPAFKSSLMSVLYTLKTVAAIRGTRKFLAFFSPV